MKRVKGEKVKGLRVKGKRVKGALFFACVMSVCLLNIPFLHASQVDSLQKIYSVEAHTATMVSYHRDNNSLWRFGFRVGANVPFSKQITTVYKAKSLLSVEFGGFVRIGKHVFGELGLGYAFQKNKIDAQLDPNNQWDFDEVVEFRYLQIPILLVGEINIGKMVTILPHAGVIYQPLLKVTENVLSLEKQEFVKHPFLFSGGVGVKVHFVTLSLSYRHAFRPYLLNSSAAKPSYLNISVGFQF